VVNLSDATSFAKTYNQNVYAISSMAESLEIAVRLARKLDGLVVFTGSFAA
jgi:hypothetical protein